MVRPKLITLALAGGILVLGAGSAVAASLPSWPTQPAHTASPSSTAGAPSPHAVSEPTASAAPDAASSLAGASRTRRAGERHRLASITYTVKPGDTLSGIAEWFKLHGYGKLYAANAAVIGFNPNLIIPGERITISHGVMTFHRAR